jgi:NADH pyrophosphatase NudC (nudix superfamily)
MPLLAADNVHDDRHASDSVPPVPFPPWYSDPAILRDRSHVIPADRGFDYRCTDEGDGEASLSPALFDLLVRSTSRIVPFQDGKVFVKKRSRPIDSPEKEVVEPLFLSYNECDASWFDSGGTVSWLGGVESDEEEDVLDYFAVDIPTSMNVEPLFRDGHDYTIESAAVRNYGDSMPSRRHAALLATANGLLTFHSSHRYCSKCGSATKQIKAGSARKCSSVSCGLSVYPRIDPAVIMLVTSPCRKYALLGRKKSWPSGRYSALAGFVEVGETLEECVVRETLEESGVKVDPASIRFSASQPWPFPRSMMLGYHATAALPSSGSDDLPPISIDPDELEDARWFSKVKRYCLPNLPLRPDARFGGRKGIISIDVRA